MKTIIEILPFYFCINFFLAGVAYAEDVKWARTREEKIKAYSLVLLMLVVGVIFSIIAILYSTASNALYFIDSYIQLQFWFTYWFNSKFYDLEPDMLEQMNKLSESKDKDTFKHRHFRYCTKLINKRNNYTPKTNSHENNRNQI